MPWEDLQEELATMFVSVLDRRDFRRNHIRIARERASFENVENVRQWRKKNHARWLEQKRRHYWANRERVLAAQQAYRDRKRALRPPRPPKATPEERRAKWKAYYLANREKILARMKVYRDCDAVRQRERELKKRKKAAKR